MVSINWTHLANENSHLFILKAIKLITDIVAVVRAVNLVISFSDKSESI